jgi:hypothetical protein
MRAALVWYCALAAAAAGAAPPQIAAIYPRGETLPANHLKFYLHFSEPMRAGVFLAHCRLLDERGQPVLEPFRETELWSDDRRRLTLWLHPGRQKTGVNLNDEFGPVLEPARHYTLVISGQWPSAQGVPLGADVKKEFRTGARATAQLDAADWKVAPPRSGTTQPLEVRFPAPLDHALLARCLRVLDARSAPVDGAVEIADGEQTWRFTPRQSWPSAAYRLTAETILEDLAGNSLARPFEVDLQAPPPRRSPPLIELPFHSVDR